MEQVKSDGSVGRKSRREFGVASFCDKFAPDLSRCNEDSSTHLAPEFDFRVQTSLCEFHHTARPKSGSELSKGLCCGPGAPRFSPYRLSPFTSAPYPFVAPAVSPPRQYLPKTTKATSKGKTLTNEPIAIRLKIGLPPAPELTLFQTLSPSVSG